MLPAIRTLILISGIASDRYGRKWPYVVNMVLFIVLELATGFCNTYEQFLAVRALYGIAMGGLYGNAAATALEDCPEEARGLISGMLQQGYAFGYLLATVFARALVNTTPHGWRPLFWFGACPPVLLIIFRLCLPETKAYIERSEVRHATGNLTKTFVAEGRVALKKHWILLTYMVSCRNSHLHFPTQYTRSLNPRRSCSWPASTSCPTAPKTSIPPCCKTNSASPPTTSPSPRSSLTSAPCPAAPSSAMPRRSSAAASPSFSSP